MADWTDQSNDSLLPGEPWTSAKAIAAFENPVAIAEGASSTPRLYLRALERLEAGDQIRSRNDAGQIFSETTPATVIYFFDFIQYGTIRVTFTVSFTTATVTVARTRNAVGTTLLTATAAGGYTVDVAVIPGDRVNVSLASGAAGGGVSNIRFQTNGQDLWPGVSARVEGNRNAT